MKILKHLLILALLLPAFAMAEPMIAPDKVLKQAALGRNELREVVMSLNFNAAEMRDMETFESYFMLLDDLQKIANENGFEELYPGVIETLGVNLTSQGMRWLSIVNSNETKLIYYVKWMNSTGVGRFLSLVEYELKDISTPEIAKKVSKNVDAIMPLIEKKAGNIPYILLGYNRIKSDAAVALLKMETLTETEAVQWISKISLSSSASEYLDYLNKGIYSINKTTVVDSHKYLARLQALLVQTKKMSEIAPGWLVTSVGESITEVLSKMLKYEEKFDEQEAETAMAVLTNRQIETLAVQLMNLQTPPNKSYVSEFMRVANLVIDGLYATGQVREGDDLKKALSKIAAPVVAQKYSIEGHYKLSNGSKTFYFTIVSSKENSLVAALVDDQFNVTKAFYNVIYNSYDNTFIASDREPDVDNVPNISVKFVVTESGKISLTDPYIRNGNQKFTGTKIQSVPNLWKNAVKDSTNAQGTYTGQVVHPNGTKMTVKLSVTSFNGYTVARMTSGDLTVDLNIGSSGTDGVLILTSGRTLQNGTWYQLRSNIVKGGLQTTVAIGGKGLGKTSTFLKKVSN